ncbi:MAG: hypothetical protein EPN50_02570, partial [Chloroflexota bacterium]
MVDRGRMVATQGPPGPAMYDGRRPARRDRPDERGRSGMIDFVVQLVINAVALLVAVEFVPGLTFAFGPDVWKVLLVALIFGVINTYLKP